MIRVAMIGGWHPHGIQCRYVKQMKDLSDCEIACVWDDDEERGKKWSETVKVPFESDYNHSFNFLIVCSVYLVYMLISMFSYNYPLYYSL